jgi:hypothetical protein
MFQLYNLVLKWGFWEMKGSTKIHKTRKFQWFGSGGTRKRNPTFFFIRNRVQYIFVYQKFV